MLHVLCLNLPVHAGGVGCGAMRRDVFLVSLPYANTQEAPCLSDAVRLRAVQLAVASIMKFKRSAPG